jgi:geranylgeranyl reductase family protein
VTTSSTRSDVAVVGGGPAGAWAAFSLARRGARVTLFDHSHPREKPCGGGVTGRALALVSEAVDGHALPAVVIRTARFDDPRTAPATVDLDARGAGPRSALLVVDRRSFDGALLEAARRAGVEHRTERVRRVEVTSWGAVVHTGSSTHASDWVIGADGANSLVRRSVTRPFSRAQLSIAAGYFAEGVTSHQVEIRFVPDPAGYIWSFPRRDHLAIGVCAQGDGTSSATLRDVVTRWVNETAPAATRLVPYGWPIPSLAASDFAHERASGARWLLAGDAAGLVDPITREGIYFALCSGQFAADALSGDAPERTYDTRLREEIYPELMRAARLKHGFFRSGFTHLLVDALRHSASVRDVMADLVAGRQPYATLKRRLIATFEVRLAWRLLMLELGGRR